MSDPGGPMANGADPEPTRGVASPLFVRVWNEVIAPKSEPFRSVLNALATEALAWVAEVGARPGERVLDVGTGWGRSARAMGERVGPGGHVTGIDCVASYLAAAAREAAEDGVGNVTFVTGDAGCHPFEPASFDVVSSVEGVMFFSDPVRAFAHLCSLLVPGGRLVMAVPRAEHENAWMFVPKNTARHEVGLPPAGPTCGPGPFSLGYRADLVRTLEAAGFVDVRCDVLDETYRMGDDVEAAIELHLQLGAVGELVRLHGLDAARIERLRTSLRAAFAPYVTADGVRFPASTWLVQARRIG